MVELSGDVTTAINLAAFVAFMVVGVLFLYIGRATSLERKLSLPWVNLFFGTSLIATNYLVQAIAFIRLSGDPVVTISSYLLVIGGAAMTFTSFLILYIDRANEANLLKKRQSELEEITKRLRNKFLKRELAEEELKKLDTDIVRELAEIEVKLDKIEKTHDPKI